ncbi:MAG: DoxX family membrane protein [Candidatus Andersenbacteria bacterium]
MTKVEQLPLFLLRVALGWLFFYSGITKVLNPEWSAAGYLAGAKTFSGLYQWFAQPEILPVINAINEWGQLLLGIALLLGIVVRLASVGGALLMLMYYFPVLEFPYIGRTAFLIDEHIIYALALWVLAAFRAGRVWGLETWCSQLPLCSKYPRWRWWLG